MKSPISPDQAKARATLAAMTARVDVQDWGQVGDCFARNVTVDYTSLWGGEAQETAAGELVAQWRAMLPGFDATRHELGPVEVAVTGDEATAEAPVTGTHILGDEAWIVEGRYRCRLAREGERWRIASLTFVNIAEHGRRELAEIARRRVATGS